MTLRYLLLATLIECLQSTGSVASTNPDRPPDSDTSQERKVEAIRAVLGPGPWYWENPRPQGNPLNAVFVVGANDVWAGGVKTLMHWDGKDWRLTEVRSTYDYVLSVRQIWGNDAENLWVVANNELYHWRDGTWLPSELPTSPYFPWGAVWGVGSNDLWTASGGGVYHWDGEWSERTPDGWQVGSAPLLWGASTDDVTVTDGWLLEHFYRWNGSTWLAIAPPPGLYLGGTGPGEPWFYNHPQRAFLRFLAGVWEAYPSPVQTSFAAWSDASGEAWALGRDGSQEDLFLHLDGKGWSVTRSVAHRLLRIGGNAPDHVWAVGEKGAIVRFNGSYEDRRAGSVADLNKIFGFSDGELWTIGDSGTVLHRTPAEWEVVQTPTQRNLLAIGGTAADDIWVVGEAGTSIHFDGKAWSNVPTTTTDPLLSVWASGPVTLGPRLHNTPFILFCIGTASPGRIGLDRFHQGVSSAFGDSLPMTYGPLVYSATSSSTIFFV